MFVIVVIAATLGLGTVAFMAVLVAFDRHMRSLPQDPPALICPGS